MKRTLEWFNLFGVCALAILCARQWGMNHDANQTIDSLRDDLDKANAKIDEQTNTLKNDEADLDDLRGRLTLSEGTVSSLQDDLAKADQEIARDRATLGLWQNAVKQRDARIAQASDVIKKELAIQNEAVQKYNALVGQYNALVSKEAGGN